MVTFPDSSAEPWLREFLPQFFFNTGPRGLMWWQLLAFPVLMAVGWVAGRVLGALARGLLHRMFRHTKTLWDDRLLKRVGPALTVLFGALTFRLLLPLVGLGAKAELFVVHDLLHTLVILTTFWALWRSVGVFTHMLLDQTWAIGNPSAKSLLNVIGNVAKAAVAIGCTVTVLASFGYPVTTAVAGLGIGGIALAFGAQKTVENLFGYVAISADQPFRIGDVVKIGAFTGEVERIGARSTRVRTPDRTLVTIPNGPLSEMAIETFGARDRIRFLTSLGLSYDTTDTQVRLVMAGVENLLRKHPKTWPDTVVVRLAALGPVSIDIEVMCWFVTTDFDQFRVFRQDALFGIMRIVADAGASFALPSQAIRSAAAKEAAAPPPPRVN